MPRKLLALTVTSALVLATSTLVPPAERVAEAAPAKTKTAVVMPNGRTLASTIVNGAREFRLVAEKVEHEVAPGMVIHAWGYNGQSPGPVIEATEGERVRIIVENKLPERTSVHWHGIFLPNGQDGVAGLNQPHIEPGATFVYEFTLKQSGVYMYHPHSDEMVQMALGMSGFFVIHPKKPAAKIDRHFVVMLHEQFVEPGTATPDPNVMTDFNLFTFNGRAYPGTDPWVAKKGERVRFTFGNLSMDSHPIHVHGYAFEEVATDGGEVPRSARRPETTVNVPVGSTRTVEMVVNEPGDWAFHCHKSHHTMNPMGHAVPNMIGVPQDGLEAKIRTLLPGYMAMGEKGMGGMHDMGRPANTLPMMTGTGPFGAIEMGGMFTVLKVRETDAEMANPGWYKQPVGTEVKRLP
jgi:FtsP/CotA-like multicopper oxidase with cupredoxin domain